MNVKKPLYGANGDMELTIKFHIKQGEFVALTGESGSGKTTLLRILAGLEEAEGEIVFDKEVWLNDKILRKPQKRHIGFVFQDYALFSNMSVEQNLLFVKRDKNLASKLLEITQLTALKNRLPHTLSGGQQQRVALCRAMMNRPKLLLLDEPLSALNPVMRSTLQNEILHLHKTFHTTTIMISHDPSEIYHLASHTIVLKNGKIIKEGNPKKILLQNLSHQRLSFEGKLLELKKVKKDNVAIVAIGQQIIEIPLEKNEAKNLTIGQTLKVNSKLFHIEV